MVSHPGSLMEQFLFVNEDGVPSWSLVEQFKHSSRNLLLMRMVSHPGQSSYCCRWCPILVNLLVADGVPSWSLVEQFKHSSRNLLPMRMVSHPDQSSYCCGWCPILVTAPKLWEGRIYFLVISAILQCNKTWCHETIVMAPEIWEGKMGFQLLFILQSDATTSWSWHQNYEREELIFWWYQLSCSVTKPGAMRQ